jgi:hypothetical protein
MNIEMKSQGNSAAMSHRRTAELAPHVTVIESNLVRLGQNLLLPHHSIADRLYLQQRTLRPPTLVHCGWQMIHRDVYAATLAPTPSKGRCSSNLEIVACETLNVRAISA